MGPYNAAMPSWFWPILTGFNYAIAIATIVTILRRRKPPASMLAWIFAILLVPVLGVLTYLLIGDTRIRRQARKRRRKRLVIARALSRHAGALAPMHADRQPRRLSSQIQGLVKIATKIGQEPPIRGNEVVIYHDADRTLSSLRVAIGEAKSHVHLEYYIFQPDDTGRAVRDAIIEKAREGVKCRLLLDAIGCWRMSRSFIRTFRDAGVEVAFFQPFRLNARLFRLNCRNHRKLVVIDGRVGFTGSQNIGDEYRGLEKKFGPWRDTHMRITGPGAAQLQEVFIEDWHFATGRDIADDESLFPPLEVVGDSVVQFVGTGPDRPSGVLHVLLLSAFSAASESISIITPYFVPDMAVVLALKAAALRGARVQLLIPARTDNRVVLWAGRSYYAELIESGVEIYEYDHGMLHSKVVIIDDKWSLVGSANMDVRSFNINFEITGLLYDDALSHELAVDFAALRDRARRFSSNVESHWTFVESLVNGMARLAAPLL